MSGGDHSARPGGGGGVPDDGVDDEPAMLVLEVVVEGDCSGEALAAGKGR